MNENQIFTELESPFNVAITAEKLIEEALKRGWQNPANHDLQQSLAKSGKEVRPVQVLEICKPEFSGKMLELNHERIVSVIMPCRISVYQKEDGKAYIALLNMESMGAGLPQTAINAIQGASAESMEIVKSVVGPI